MNQLPRKARVNDGTLLIGLDVAVQVCGALVGRPARDKSRQEFQNGIEEEESSCLLAARKLTIQIRVKTIEKSL